MVSPTIDDYYAHIVTDIVPSARLRGALGKFSYNNLKMKSALTYGVDDRGYVLDVIVAVSARVFPKQKFDKSGAEIVAHLYPMLSVISLESGKFGLSITSSFELTFDRSEDVSELELLMDELLESYLEFDREFRRRSAGGTWNPILGD